MPDQLDRSDVDAVVAGVRAELRTQQNLVSGLPSPRARDAMLTFLSHGLRQLRWLEQQRKLILIGRFASGKPE